jgi:hypothetical protein
MNTNIIPYEDLITEYSIDNFETIRIRLSEELESYDFDDLTPENYEEKKGFAKQRLVDLNKISKAFLEKGKEMARPYQDKVDVIIGHTKNFSQMCTQKRETLLIPIEQFEALKKEECYKLLQAKKTELYAKYQIEQEFQTITDAQVEKFALIGSITGKGKLSASGERAINELVLQCLVTQNKIMARVGKLVNVSIEHNLDFIPHVNDISHFLSEESDEIYEQKLNQYIAREKEKIEQRKADELKRQKEAEERATRIKKDVEEQHQVELRKIQEIEEKKRQDVEEKARLDERKRVEAELKQRHSVDEESHVLTISEIPETRHAPDFDLLSINTVLKLPKGTDINKFEKIAEARINELGACGKTLFPKSFYAVKVGKVN